MDLTKTLKNQMNQSFNGDEVCPKCGQPIVKEVELLGVKRLVPVACECMKKEWEYQEKARKNKMRQQRIDRLFALSELGPRYKDSSFENWLHRNGTELWYKTAKDYVSNFGEYLEEGHGLVIVGPVGNGKTYLAAAIVRKLIAEQERVCLFQSVPSLVTKLQATYNGGQTGYTSKEVFDNLHDADLVVLDDLGSEYKTSRQDSWVEATLYSIIDDRYRWKKPVIVISNLSTEKELLSRVGARTYDRLLEMCTFLGNKGTSYRKEIAKRRNNGEKKMD